MKTSVSSYSFAQYIRAGKMTQLDCVSKAKEMGFDSIEFIEIDGSDDLEKQKENAAKIREKADKLDVKITAYTVGACLFHETTEEMEKEIARLKNQVDIAKILGADLLRHDVCYRLGKKGASRSFDLMLPYIADNARKVTEYAETLGIKTCSENHGFYAQDSDRIERLFNAVNHDNFGLLIDIGNFVCADENFAHAVSRVASYAIHVHAKDFIIRNEPTGICRNPTRGGNFCGGTIIGEGDVPVKQCLRILDLAGYDGYVSIEYEGAEDCIVGISRGKENLEKMFDDIKKYR